MNKTLEQKIREVQQGLDCSYTVSKLRIPFTWMSQKTPREIADMIRIETMNNVESLESMYFKRPHTFVQIVTDRAKIALQIEKCGTIEEARKILMDCGLFR